MSNESLKPVKEYFRFNDIIILDILRTEMRGSDLVVIINEKCEKRASISSVFPVLNRLEMQEYVTSWDFAQQMEQENLNYTKQLEKKVKKFMRLTQQKKCKL